MKKSDKRVIWVLAFYSVYKDTNGGVVAEFVPEENPLGRYVSERIVRAKYHQLDGLREVEGMTAIYKLKPRPRGRPRRSD